MSIEINDVGFFDEPMPRQTRLDDQPTAEEVLQRIDEKNAVASAAPRIMSYILDGTRLGPDGRFIGLVPPVDEVDSVYPAFQVLDRAQNVRIDPISAFGVTAEQFAAARTLARIAYKQQAAQP